MPEIWLHNNRRALALATIAPVGIALAGLVLSAILWANGLGSAARWLGLALAALGTVIGVAMIFVLLRELRRPRLALDGDRLLIYLAAGRPYRLPLECVECFLLGHAPALLPGRAARRDTRTLVVRVSESAAEWQDRPTHAPVGTWCGGYITLRGTWCEPLDVALVNRLNARLAEVQARAAGASP